tara:strand:+ start:2906 stop:3652 length:747 start_codon:yes stop_codon:yes gene_type:complete
LLRFNTILIFIINFIVNLCNAQSNDKIKNFGFEFTTIVPVDYFGAGPKNHVEDYSEIKMSSKIGYQFGMSIKTKYNERLYLESGINFIRRNFSLTGSSEFNGTLTSDTSSFGYISYGIPLRGLVFIRLAKKIFMNTSVGTSLDFYASAVNSKGVNYYIDHISDRARWINGSLNGEIGFELRDQFKGTFHIGFGVNIPISTIAVTKLKYYYDDFNQNNYDRYDNIFLRGNFFSVILKYYLPRSLEDKNI